jgi:hypothetical protein
VNHIALSGVGARDWVAWSSGRLGILAVFERCKEKVSTTETGVATFEPVAFELSK